MTKLNTYLFQSRAFTLVYEKAWRPALTRVLTGMSHGAERAWSVEHLAPKPGATVLDLACGPGNTTRSIAAQVPGGRVLGIDFSEAMLRQAVKEPTPGVATTSYVRGDAHRLPVRSGSVDAVNCSGAFYLFSDPKSVAKGIAVALVPGGRFTLMASRKPRAGGAVAAALAQLAGVHVFAPGEIERLLDEAGFDVVDRRNAGFMVLLATCRRA